VARDRQRSKQRQAERRAARLSAAGLPPERDDARDDPRYGRGNGSGVTESGAEVAAGAPPENAGRSDTVVAPSPGGEPVGREGRLSPREEVVADDERGGGRVITFLRGVVAELRRVQWPNRNQLTSLTGIVLGFCLIAGGYLGLLDAVFSRLIRVIL
jgi:preprotein translocase subunit SecE